MHAAIDLVLTEKEKNALYNYYEKKTKEQNRDVDEVIADAYRDWVLARQRKSGTMFGKLWRKVKDFCTRIKAIFDKGAGKATLDGVKMSDDVVYGDGENSIEIDGGVGDMKIEFSD